MELLPHLAVTADGAVVLDVQHNRVLRLNPIGVDIWRAIEQGRSQTEIVYNISARYRISQDLAAKDVQLLIGKLRHLSIWPAATRMPSQEDKTSPCRCSGQSPELLSAGADGGSSTDVPFLMIRALIGLAAFDAFISLRSFAAVCEKVRNWKMNNRARVSTRSAIEQVCSAVDKACVWYPKAALCLQRSAVTTCLLRQCGVPARMVIGTVPMPFLAHAWVEVEGRVVNDRARVNAFYVHTAEY